MIMKMSDGFITPVHIQKMHLEDCELSRGFVGDGLECKLSSLAINNHDKLVGALSSIIKHTNHYGTCECCDVDVGYEFDEYFDPVGDENPPHKKDCKVKHAMDLLEDLESKS